MSDQIFDFIIAELEKKGPIPGHNKAEKLRFEFLNQGHIDSFGLMNLIMTIEDEFDVTLSAEDTQSEEFRSIGGTIKIIERNMIA